MTVRFANEPNYELVEEGLRRLLMSMTPEQRRKYAYKVGEDARKDDQSVAETEKSPQNRI
ncbi:MAG: hypothetical protein ACI36Y_06700 [Coriobacteriales bacterium]